MADRDMKRPAPDAPPGIYEKVISLLECEVPGKVLDAPAGEGPFSVELKKQGYQVWAADLNEEKFKAEEILFNKVNLNEKLPYQDDFFDLVVSIEGIEHLENPHHLIGEFKRVLRLGGKLILSTPNTLNVYSRLRYFIFGSPDRHHSEIGLFKGSMYQVLRRHINPVGYPELKFILENNGFKIENIATNNTIFVYRGGRFIIKIIMPIIFLLIGGLVKIIAGNIRKQDSLSGVLLARELLFGEALIVKAKNELELE